MSSGQAAPHRARAGLDIRRGRVETFDNVEVYGLAMALLGAMAPEPMAAPPLRLMIAGPGPAEDLRHTAVTAMERIPQMWIRLRDQSALRLPEY